MGLFNNKTEEDKINEAYTRVAGASMVDCRVVTGKHGTDEIIAGAMMGETGKLIGMANYGKPKYEKSVLEFHINGIVFTNPNWRIMYDDVIKFEIQDRFRHADVTIYLSDGDRIICEMLKYEAYASRKRIRILKEDYMKRMAAEEQEKQEKLKEEEKDKNMDRLLRAAELHERGLLDDEEFQEIKNNFMNKKEKQKQQETETKKIETVSINYCPECGTKIKEDYKFCTNCGYQIN